MSAKNNYLGIMAVIYAGQLQDEVLRCEILEQTQWSSCNNAALMDIYCAQGAICTNRRLFEMFILVN